MGEIGDIANREVFKKTVFVNSTFQVVRSRFRIGGALLVSDAIHGRAGLLSYR